MGSILLKALISNQVCVLSVHCELSISLLWTAPELLRSPSKKPRERHLLVCNYMLGNNNARACLELRSTRRKIRRQRAIIKHDHQVTELLHRIKRAGTVPIRPDLYKDESDLDAALVSESIGETPCT
ncbi:hypothetical protein ANCDUO_02571 [Ancylostoma duodenale]|uniref:Uncharacterized protein n=1 Tax=Ancylostoma duodenale TaxID=51022 RepID=A0A0C2H6E6_9BILA|nr:hypothetical protein ANCDUO_02571 [Ancylostoma duodenale]